MMALVPLLAQLAAVDLRTGRVIEKVPCRAGEPHSYALYLPSAYTPERTWPILYCLDPGARGRIPVERFRGAAESYGWILVGSNASRNGPWQPNVAAFKALWEDTQLRFSIDSRRIYAAGFSGGARVAAALAAAMPEISGVIGCGAGFPGPVPKTVSFAWFGAAGVDDFNYIDVRQVQVAVAATGQAARFVVFDGAHNWPPEPVCTAAVEWLEVQAMKTGRRPRDPALVKTLLEKRRGAMAAVEAGLASSEYGALAADFGGLAEVAAYEKEAERLQSSRERKAYLKREADLEKRQQSLHEDLAALIQDQDLSAFRASVGDLAKKASSPADSPDRRVARRVLSGQYIGLIEQSRALSGPTQQDQRRLLEDAIAVLRPALSWWVRRLT